MVVATTSVFLTTLLLCIMLSTDYAYNWIEILNRAGSTISRIEKSRLLRSIASADFTAGAVSISTPPISSESMLQMENTELEDDENMASMYRSTLGKSITVNGTRPGLARMHRLSRTIIRKVPDGALIGIVALITTELIQREVIRQSTSFPPIMQALANRTLSELDGKLQLLSFLQWNFEPFLRVEVENLQTQPVELLDKYIVTEILQRVDKELSPFLTKLLADPGKVKDITAKIKDIIKLLALLVIKPSNRVSNSPLGKTTNSIIENVEVVGMSVESGKGQF